MGLSSRSKGLNDGRIYSYRVLPDAMQGFRMNRYIILFILALFSANTKADTPEGCFTTQSYTTPISGSSAYNQSAYCTSKGLAYQLTVTKSRLLQSDFNSVHCPSSEPIDLSDSFFSDTLYARDGTGQPCQNQANTGTVYYPSSTSCSSIPPISGSGEFSAANHGDKRCFGGCAQILTETATDWTFTNNGDMCASQTFATSCGTGYAYNSTFAVCEALPPDADGDGVPDSTDEWPFDPLRTVDTDNDGIADEFDDFPADSTENADTDGDGVGDNADFAPTDETNGEDAGTGQEDDNTSTGGGNCENPPHSVGEPITAQIAFQTWKGRCAAEAQLEELKKITGTVTGDVTNCAGTYTCSGGSIQCAQVHALRKTICSTSTGGTGATNPGDENSNGVPDSLETGITDPDTIDLESIKDRGGSSGDWANDLDTNGFLGGGTCPGLPQLLGSTAISEMACEQGGILQAMIQIFALFFAAMIVGKSLSGA